MVRAYCSPFILFWNLFVRGKTVDIGEYSLGVLPRGGVEREGRQQAQQGRSSKGGPLSQQISVRPGGGPGPARERCISLFGIKYVSLSIFIYRE
jgi:hypothetical protein